MMRFWCALFLAVVAAAAGWSQGRGGAGPVLRPGDKIVVPQAVLDRLAERVEAEMRRQDERLEAQRVLSWQGRSTIRLNGEEWMPWGGAYVGPKRGDTLCLSILTMKPRMTVASSPKRK
jgi:hypothetical protein